MNFFWWMMVEKTKVEDVTNGIPVRVKVRN